MSRLLEKSTIVKAAALKNGSRKQVSGFIDFIRTQGVAGLAVGLVLGGAITLLVKSFIDNIVMPQIGLMLGSSEGLKDLTLNLGRTANGKGAIVYYGTFLSDLINFLVIAVVVYLVIHLLGFDKLDKKKE